MLMPICSGPSALLDRDISNYDQVFDNSYSLRRQNLTAFVGMFFVGQTPSAACAVGIRRVCGCSKHSSRTAVLACVTKHLALHSKASPCLALAARAGCDSGNTSYSVPEHQEPARQSDCLFRVYLSQ